MRNGICLFQWHSNENAALSRLTLPNHTAYADVHGYSLVRESINPYDPNNWRYLVRIKELLSVYEAVVQVGTDVLFTRPETPITNICPLTTAYALYISEEDIGGAPINNDLVVWQSNHWAYMLIEKLLEEMPRYVGTEWLSQQALIDMMIMDCWKQLMIVVPPRVLQSTPVKPYPRSEWQPGDFALHFLAMGVEDKMQRIQHFLNTGAVMWRS